MRIKEEYNDKTHTSILQKKIIPELKKNSRSLLAVLTSISEISNPIFFNCHGAMCNRFKI